MGSLLLWTKSGLGEWGERRRLLRSPGQVNSCLAREEPECRTLLKVRLQTLSLYWLLHAIWHGQGFRKVPHTEEGQFTTIRWHTVHRRTETPSLMCLQYFWLCLGEMIKVLWTVLDWILDLQDKTSFEGHYWVHLGGGGCIWIIN